MFIGDPDASSYPDFLKALCGRDFKTVTQIKGWTRWEAADHGCVDARVDDAEDIAALNALEPDVIIALHNPKNTSHPAQDRLQKAVSENAFSVPILILENEDGKIATIGQRTSALCRLDARGSIMVATNFKEIPDVLCEMLPPQARLEMARVSDARASQKQIADTLLKSFAAICGVIGLQPIPLADLPVLTSLQMLLVGLIVHASGRKLSIKSIGEFMGALGVGIGAAFAFREGARTLVRFLPIWGNAVSGGVAAIGTYAIGKSAIAYFIEGLPQHEVRKIFKSLKSRRQQSKLPPGDKR